MFDPIKDACKDDNGEATLAASLYKISEDDQLIAEHVIDTTGKLKMYHPVTQKVLFTLLRNEILKELRELKKKNEEKVKENKRIENIAKVARKLAESD